MRKNKCNLTKIQAFGLNFVELRLIKKYFIQLKNEINVLFYFLFFEP
jgi:hypothetical protein